MFRGRERGCEEMGELLRAAGFRLARVADTRSLMRVIEAVPTVPIVPTVPTALAAPAAPTELAAAPGHAPRSTPVE